MDEKKLEIDTKYGHPIFYEELGEIARIHGSKNQDYGGGDPLGNFLECSKIGIPPLLGIIVRMGDKWSRINSLIRNKGVAAVKDESLIDTLRDLAVYSMLATVIFKLFRFSVPKCDLGSPVFDGKNDPLTTSDSFMVEGEGCDKCLYGNAHEPDGMPCKKCLPVASALGIFPHFRQGE